MSTSKDAGESSSSGTIQRTTRNKNRNSGKHKKRHQGTESSAGGNEQTSAAEGLFEVDHSPTRSSSLTTGEPAETSQCEIRCKKRNKSVSFAVDESEAVAAKKTKTEDIPVSRKHESRIFRNSRIKKHKKNRVFKDHPVDEEMEPGPSTSAAATSGTKKSKRKAEKPKPKAVDDEIEEDMEMNSDDENNETNGTKYNAAPEHDDTNNTQPQKPKKRKHHKKQAKMDDEEEEPTIKVRKESMSEDDLTEELENMHIGSKPNNLIDLLDDMVPAGPKPYKAKRDRQTFPKSNVNAADANSNEFDLKKVVKWTKKRWNKDRKGATSASSLNTSVVIHNLPVVMTSVYRKKLIEVFEKFGQIKRIGPAEVQPSEDDEAMFSTTIYFDTEYAATKALEEDNTRFGGSVIRVRRPLPPTQTTAVARSYAELPLCLEELHAVFGGVGELRGVRALPRRKQGMATVFLEYTEPEAVQRALALSETKIKGKKVYLQRFEARKNKEPSENAATT